MGCFCGENVHMDHFSFYYGALVFLLWITFLFTMGHFSFYCWYTLISSVLFIFFFERLPTSPPPSAYIQIDTDGDGKITEREFVNWTQGGEVTDLVEQRVGAP